MFQFEESIQFLIGIIIELKFFLYRIPSIVKSSFRDSNKPPRFSRDSVTTRFQVDGKDDSDSNDEDRESLLDSDTKYGRSFRHFTREALPRLDNYRNILSIQAVYRPTLDELHNATLTGKVITISICYI